MSDDLHSDDMPLRAPRRARERGSAAPLSAVPGAPMATRAASKSTCAGCGERIPLEDPRTTPHPTKDGQRGTSWISYGCLSCGERTEINSRDVVRYCVTIGAGQAPAVMETLRKALLLSMSAMAKATERGDLGKVAANGGVTARLAELLLSVGGVKKEMLEVHHTGGIGVGDSDVLRSRAAEMALEFLRSNGLMVIDGKVCPVQDAEVIE